MEDHHSVLTVNTTDTEYLLQSQDCQLSDYQVEIAAVNVVGVGDKYTSPPLTLDGMYLIFQTNFSFNLGENPVISFQTKGCRIVIIPEGRGGDCELNTTATRLEGAGDARVNVELPAGEYSVVVYDDEQVTEENPAYTTTLSIPGATTPVVGCVFDVLVVEPTSDSEENNFGLVIGVVVAVAVMSVAALVGSLIFAMIYSRGVYNNDVENILCSGARNQQQRLQLLAKTRQRNYLKRVLPVRTES
ncbi:hypothetical protein GBAR_LOCUS4127 [Geodia barretti]|uniref:Uncharacterized protein n=1 Tax=Geodia barretti TaxID=519541 RepID=A0AA35R5Q3_GEOBA|nr:hypothetical protein GBAR_LOCUS4127 [Geodia barretti]